MSSRKDELLQKKARLAELKRQRELRQEQLSTKRQSIGESSSPGRTVEERRSEIDSLVNSLIDRRRDSTTTAAPSPSRQSRPSSLYGTGPSSSQDGGETTPRTPKPQMVSIAIQTSAGDEASITSQETAPPDVQPPKKEYITYNKGVQTEDYQDALTSPADDDDDIRFRSRRRSSKRDKEAEEQIRAGLRKEIEDELRATQNGEAGHATTDGHQRFPLRTLNDKELNAVTASTEFVSFVERSSKVIERALDEEYDVLADYTRTAALHEDDDDAPYTRHSKKAHSLRESLQLFSDRHSRRRKISDIHFSSHFSELLLTSYTKNPSAPNEPPGQVLLWNIHAPSRPEYIFTSSSDVLSSRFSPFHPNYVIGGCYSGQICLWDTRSNNSSPVQRTPQSGSHLGHTHPVYNIAIVGTPNAHNIITASMDGVVCSWSFDMLTQAQEYLVLHTPQPPAKTEDLAPTSLSFPSSDPTFFLVGTEEGSIYPCHRYDRAGAKAGVDRRLAYRSHTAPVMSTHFHPSRGPVDLSDLLLSSSSDWSLKLWRVKPAASSSAAAAVQAANSAATTSNQPAVVSPVLDIPREDLVYDARWHPHRPSIFSCVTGAGELEVFDLLYDTEVPIAKASPTRGKNGVMPFKGLNKCAWEERRGQFVATGGLDGVVSVFETGRGLQGALGEEKNAEEWVGVRKVVSRGIA